MGRQHDDYESNRDRDDLINQRLERDHSREPVRRRTRPPLNERGTLRTLFELGDTIAKVGLVLLLATAFAACVDVEPEPAPVSHTTLFVCHTHATCSSRTPATVDDEREFCAPLTEVDRDGSLAASDWATNWRTACEQDEGVVSNDGEDVCTGTATCAVECDPQYVGCDIGGGA